MEVSAAPPRTFRAGDPVGRRARWAATLRGDVTAVGQLDNWLERRQDWVERSVSATIYAGDREWMALGAEVCRNPDRVAGPAFLPCDDGTHKYAPNEEPSEGKYDETLGKSPGLNRAELAEHESEDAAESARTFACVGDRC